LEAAVISAIFSAAGGAKRASWVEAAKGRFNFRIGSKLAFAAVHESGPGTRLRFAAMQHSFRY
jgi:hypothetical protein